MSLRPFPLGYRIALEVASEMICIHLPDWPLLPLLNIFRIDWGGVEQETSSSIIIREAPTPIARTKRDVRMALRDESTGEEATLNLTVYSGWCTVEKPSGSDDLRTGEFERVWNGTARLTRASVTITKQWSTDSWTLDFFD